MVARGGIEPPTRGFSDRCRLFWGLANQPPAALASSLPSHTKAHSWHTQSEVVTFPAHRSLHGSITLLLWRQAGIDREDCPGSGRATIVCGSVYNTARSLKQEVGSSPIGAAAESECLQQRARWSDRIHRPPELSVGIGDPQVAVAGLNDRAVTYLRATLYWGLKELLEAPSGGIQLKNGLHRVAVRVDECDPVQQAI